MDDALSLIINILALATSGVVGLSAARPPQSIATSAAPQPVWQHLLPASDPRCRIVERHLRCIDQSIALTTGPRANSDAIPIAQMMDECLQCDTGTTWAPIGCHSDATIWRLALRITKPACGDTLSVIVSAYSDFNVKRTVKFTCDSHPYPFVFKAQHKYVRISWSGNTKDSRPVNITIHMYARFQADLPKSSRQSECTWRDGFWCLQDNASCIYYIHRCNGQDDCLDGNDTSLLSGSDELNCRYDDSHRHRSAAGGQQELAGDGISRKSSDLGLTFDGKSAVSGVQGVPTGVAFLAAIASATIMHYGAVAMSMEL